MDSKHRATASDLIDAYGLRPEMAEMLARYNFDTEGFDSRRRVLAEAGVDPARNLVHGKVELPGRDDCVVLPPSGSGEHKELAGVGSQAIADGEVGVVLLAGGMATRFGGGVKALADVLPGLRFIDVKVKDLSRASIDHGVSIDMILMTSFQSDAVLVEAAADLSNKSVRIETAPQNVSLRVTPTGDLFTDADGVASPYAPGHGDLGDAMRASGQLERFTSAGGRYLFVTNVDNTGATLDPAVVGLHLRAGNPLTCEVTPPAPGVTGGAPYFLDGHLQILESFRVPAHVDQSSLVALNTNSLVVDAEQLRVAHDLTWFEVEKVVEGQDVVQFERLVGELSAMMPTTMALVESDGVDGRFQPVKDPAELTRRQQGITEILRSRGILS